MLVLENKDIGKAEPIITTTTEQEITETPAPLKAKQKPNNHGKKRENIMGTSTDRNLREELNKIDQDP